MNKPNKDGYFRSTFYFEGKQYVSTGKTQREADRKAIQKQGQLERGELGISPNMTVKRWSKEWLQTYKKNYVGPKAYSDYARRLDYIDTNLGGLRLTEVKDIHLQRLLNTLNGTSQSNINKTSRLVRSLFRQAFLSRLIFFDPAAGLTTPTGSTDKRRSITDLEREHILKIAETHHGGLWIKTLLYTGIRTGESIALTWGDIDFATGMITINKAYDGFTGDIKGPKTEAGNRVIPLPDFFVNELSQLKGDPFNPVFMQPRGRKQHTQSSIRRLWLSFKKELNISMGARYEKQKALDGKMRNTLVLSVVADDLIPYCLRHTFCTDLQAKGVTLKDASYVMGHSNISVTADIYTHVTNATLQDMQRLINQKPPAHNKA